MTTVYHNMIRIIFFRDRDHRTAARTCRSFALMKAIFYSVKPDETGLLGDANSKNHDISIITNKLNDETLTFAFGKQVAVVTERDILDTRLLDQLHGVGIRYIITRSKTTDHIDLTHAGNIGINVANIPGDDQDPETIARLTFRNLDLWETGKCVGAACCCQKLCVSRLNI